jgi:hypothetical protein
LKTFGLHTITPTPNANVSFWNTIQKPLPKYTWDMHIIAVWNTKVRNGLNACNKNWLIELDKEIQAK